MADHKLPKLSLTLRATPCLLKALVGQSGGESSREFLSRKNVGRAGPKVPVGLLNQAGDRQCSLSELGDGKTSSHTYDMQKPQAQSCEGVGGMRSGGASSMSSTPRGAWLGPWPSW